MMDSTDEMESCYLPEDEEISEARGQAAELANALKTASFPDENDNDSIVSSSTSLDGDVDEDEERGAGEQTLRPMAPPPTPTHGLHNPEYVGLALKQWSVYLGNVLLNFIHKECKSNGHEPQQASALAAESASKESSTCARIGLGVQQQQQQGFNSTTTTFTPTGYCPCCHYHNQMQQQGGLRPQPTLHNGYYNYAATGFGTFTSDHTSQISHRGPYVSPLMLPFKCSSEFYTVRDLTALDSICSCATKIIVLYSLMRVAQSCELLWPSAYPTLPDPSRSVA